MKFILNTTNSNVFRDLRINSSRIFFLGNFWDVEENNIEVTQTTTDDNLRRGNATADDSIAVNMWAAISAKEIDDKCIESVLSSSLNEKMHPDAARKYTGRLKIRYMVHQRSTRNSHHNDSIPLHKMQVCWQGKISGIFSFPLHRCKRLQWGDENIFKAFKRWQTHNLWATTAKLQQYL